MAQAMAGLGDEVGHTPSVIASLFYFSKCGKISCVCSTLINHNFVLFDNLKEFTTTNVLRVV